MWGREETGGAGVLFTSAAVMLTRNESVEL